MANNVEPDQMPHSVAYYLGLHCLQRPLCPILRVITVLLGYAVIYPGVHLETIPRVGVG